MKRLISVNSHVEGWENIKVEPPRFFRREDFSSIAKRKAQNLFLKEQREVEKEK